MTQIAMTRVAVPANTPEGKGKAIVLAQLNNSAGIIDPEIWELLVGTIQQIVRDAVTASEPGTDVLLMEYSVQEGQDPVALTDLPHDYDNRVDSARKLKSTKASLTRQLIAQLLKGPSGDLKTDFGPMAQQLKTMNDMVPGTLPAHAKAVLDRMVGGDFGPETVELARKSAAQLQADRAANQQNNPVTN